MQLLTASRMASQLACPRQHYWRYERGLQRLADSAALAFGTSWHAALEARSRGADLTAQLAAAVGAAQVDELQVATLGALLAGYGVRYATDSFADQELPEIAFDLEMAGSRRFRLAGKIDCLVVGADGAVTLREYKTTSDSLDSGSDYWLRLRANAQVWQYVDAARALGHNVTRIIYDVTRKPQTEPRSIPVLDAEGLKVVTWDATGERVFLANGKPRQAAQDGQTLQSRKESAEEYGDRLAADCQARPEFYFARREVAVLDADLDEFRETRVQVARMILDRRRQQVTGQEHRAWPRHVSGDACRYCQYADWCLSGIVPDTQHPPAGFVFGEKFPELQEKPQ